MLHSMAKMLLLTDTMLNLTAKIMLLTDTNVTFNG